MVVLQRAKLNTWASRAWAQGTRHDRASKDAHPRARPGPALPVPNASPWICSVHSSATVPAEVPLFCCDAAQKECPDHWLFCTDRRFKPTLERVQRGGCCCRAAQAGSSIAGSRPWIIPTTMTLWVSVPGITGVLTLISYCELNSHCIVSYMDLKVALDYKRKVIALAHTGKVIRNVGQSVVCGK